MRWVGDAEVDSGVSERRFDVDVDGRPVPGILWAPDRDPTGPRPLVLVGHGATLHKRVEHIVALAGLLVRRHGIAAAAIDSPGHGDRRRDRSADPYQQFSDFLAEWARPGSTDDMVADWHGALAALRELDEVGDGPLGYWGLSMGTIYGIPFVASEPRVQAAVFGLLGLLGPTVDRMRADGKSLTCPVLFIQQWDDQLVPRESVFELFDLIGSTDKRLHAHPGEHAAVPAEELVFSVEFLARHLAPADSALRSL
jgi:alpha-beta hydrolase superfamily lysophospholipase